MRQNTFLPIAIFALNCDSEEHERSLIEAAGFNAYKPMEGCYKGEKESAWLVPICNTEQKAALLALAAMCEQESVLFSGIDRVSTLHYVKTGETEVVGVLIETSKEGAESRDCYTYDPEANTYWVAQ